jgi:hypothetical protein
MKLDSATVYQIFWKAYSGLPKTEIARQLGVARNTVAWHLSGRLIPQYPERLRQRIQSLGTFKSRRRDIPPGMISIAESSYFFPTRPTVRTILAHYGMQTKIVGGVTYTTATWALEHAQQRFPNPPSGICMTIRAARTVYGETHATRSKIVRLSEIDCRRTPASIVHAATQIMEWTQCEFVTLDELDVIRFR